MMQMGIQSRIARVMPRQVGIIEDLLLQERQLLAAIVLHMASLFTKRGVHQSTSRGASSTRAAQVGLFNRGCLFDQC
jgi:hypothetical protein